MQKTAITVAAVLLAGMTAASAQQKVDRAKVELSLFAVTEAAAKRPHSTAPTLRNAGWVMPSGR